MEKITLDKINIGNIVVARNGWTGYITEIEEVDNSFVSNLTKKTVETTAKVLIGVRTDGEKEGFIFRCPAYMVGRTFSQIGIYKINDNSEIISAAKTIEKLSSEEVKYIVPINKDGERAVFNEKSVKKIGGYGGRENGMLCAAINEQLIDKINELVETVNELRRSPNEYYRKD